MLTPSNSAAFFWAAAAAASLACVASRTVQSISMLYRPCGPACCACCLDCVWLASIAAVRTTAHVSVLGQLGCLHCEALLLGSGRHQCMLQLAESSLGICCCFAADLSNLNQGIKHLRGAAEAVTGCGLLTPSCQPDWCCCRLKPQPCLHMTSAAAAGWPLSCRCAP